MKIKFPSRFPIFKRKLVISLGIIFLILLFFLIYLNWQIHTPLSSDATKRVFLITKGEGISEIANNLKNQGFIKSPFAFQIYVALKGATSHLQAGEYLLSSSMTMAEITELFTSGETKKIKITIPEGFNLKEISQYLEREGIVSGKDFLAESSNSEKYKKEFDFLESIPKRKNLEGFLFPDTYFLPTEVNSELIVRKMLLNFDQKLTSDLQNQINQSGFNLYQFITLASIVEKEVPNFEDRQLVAGIFYKRLKEKKFLQSCSTVEYVLRTGKRILTSEDLKVNSPYNTYLHPGLPPGPISNPGMEAILATLKPKPSPYWYFLSPDSKETLFFKTFAEQEEAKAKYLK